MTRQHILQAITEYDSRGAENLLGVYGFAASRDTFAHEGRTYDTKAVLGVAHRYATGRAATTEELTGGKVDTGKILRKCGFEAAPRPSTPTARKRPAPQRQNAVPEPEPAICPTCSMTLPATGVCDDCG
ncbi:hypothetical protein [Isoptericola cucumis]|uniref:hypothetical protein n=1 Tax=Isoptericola cucumis TaxID=1776856 RepID=UPI001E2ECE7C|nr:hypothetical protein [Isoptericola cucumis]